MAVLRPFLVYFNYDFNYKYYLIENQKIQSLFANCPCDTCTSSRAVREKSQTTGITPLRLCDFA